MKIQKCCGMFFGITCILFASGQNVFAQDEKVILDNEAKVEKNTSERPRAEQDLDDLSKNNNTKVNNKTSANKSTVFIPSEEISEDKPVPFPVDI